MGNVISYERLVGSYPLGYFYLASAACCCAAATLEAGLFPQEVSSIASLISDVNIACKLKACTVKTASEFQMQLKSIYWSEKNSSPNIH